MKILRHIVFMANNKEDDIKERLHDQSTRSKAFEEVVREFSEQLYWQIRRMVGSHDDANDILQNTFVKAWTNIDYFRGEAKLSIDEADSNFINMLEGDPYFDGDETQLMFQKAIRTLPEKQRIIFNLRYFQEMKYEDISEIVGTTVGALKASYHHAVKKIEEFFKQND